MDMKLMAAVVALAVVLGACGGAAPSPQGSGGQPAETDASSSSSSEPQPWPEPRLRRLIGLRRSPVDLTYRLAAHPECVTGALLRSAAEVQTYKAAGDVVITNRTGSAGVKTSGDSAACQRLFTRALAKVHS